MTDLSFPIHKLCRVNNQQGIILAATGTHIQSFVPGENLPTHLWPPTGDEESSEDEGPAGDPPRKRRKTENGSAPQIHRNGSERSEASIEFKVEGQARHKGERRRPKIPDLSLPHFTHIVATSDGQHVISLTAEDKAVRVFKISRTGRLSQLSTRSMPKKGCAITLSQDQTTILVADKFGDVYSLPLHPDLNYSKPKPTAEPPSQPSASALTVHTKGNLEALRQQMNQKQKSSRKEGPAFEHKLLLGHVSLLTDLLTATHNSRPYLLTADRDEHIRVSRGIPQTHIIHTFCLGATDFVSKLFIPSWNSSLLIAGNGEPSLRLYSWQEGREVSRFDILATLGSEIGAERTRQRLAVSGIWELPQANNQTTRQAILIALEGMAKLFVLDLEDGELNLAQTIEVLGNVLDVTSWDDVIAVAVDTAHEPGSVKSYRAGEAVVPPVQFFQLAVDGLVPRSDLTMTPDPIPIDSLLRNQKPVHEPKRNGEDAKKDDKNFSPLGELIYGLENLRKRRDTAAEDDGDEDEREAVPEPRASVEAQETP